MSEKLITVDWCHLVHQYDSSDDEEIYLKRSKASAKFSKSPENHGKFDVELTYQLRQMFDVAAKFVNVEIRKMKKYIRFYGNYLNWDIEEHKSTFQTLEKMLEEKRRLRRRYKMYEGLVLVLISAKEKKILDLQPNDIIIAPDGKMDMMEKDLCLAKNISIK